MKKRKVLTTSCYNLLASVCKTISPFLRNSFDTMLTSFLAVVGLFLFPDEYFQAIAGAM
jgi:hypothetical protein